MASQALYAECGPNEGSMEYARHQNAQARFELAQPSGSGRVEEDEDSAPTHLTYSEIIEIVPSMVPTTSDVIRAEGRKPRRLGTRERHAVQIAALHSRAAIGPPHHRNRGPP
jgi:hypothetical protein